MQTLVNTTYNIPFTRFLEDPVNGISKIDSSESTTLFKLLLKVMTSLPSSEFTNEKGEMDFVKANTIMDIVSKLKKADIDGSDVIEFESHPYDKLMDITKKVAVSHLNEENYKFVLHLKDLREVRDREKKEDLKVVQG